MQAMTQAMTQATAVDDRISRMLRALTLAHIMSQSGIFQIEMIGREIEQKQVKLRSTPPMEMKKVMDEIEALEKERNQFQEWRRKIALMVYNTVRDVYNADAAPESRIEV